MKKTNTNSGKGKDLEVAISNGEPPPDQPEHPEQSPAVIGCAVFVGSLLGASLGLALSYLLFALLPTVMSLDVEDSLTFFLIAAAMLSLLGTTVGAWFTWRRPFPPNKVL